MGIFTLLIIIPIILISALSSMLILRLCKLPINLKTALIFTLSGGLTGVLIIIVVGYLLSDDNGQLDSTLKIFSVFILAIISAMSVGILSVKQAIKT